MLEAVGVILQIILHISVMFVQDNNNSNPILLSM